MSVFAGPNIASNSNLVFAYDMNNTQKSWIGPPITNLVTNKTLTAHGGNTPTINNSYSLVAPDNSTGWSSILSSGPTGNYRLAQFPYITLTSGTTYTASMEFFTTETQTLSVFMDGNAGLTPTNIPNGYSKWTFTFTATNNWVENIFIGSFNTISSTTYSPPKLVYFKNPQLEVGSFATPYVENSRTNTQAILDLTRNNIITATSLTYLSSGTFSFNGTSDFLRPNITHSYLNSSCLEVWFNSTNHGGSQRKTIFGYAHNEGYSYPTIGTIFLEGNTLSASVITASQVYRTVTASTAINTNTWYCAVLNKNTSTGNLDLYLNGSLSGTQTFDTVSYGQWTTTGTFIGSNILDIGKSTNNNVGQGWSTSYFSGSIPIAKVYNRVLTAAEIAQNFNATRSRFGL